MRAESLRRRKERKEIESWRAERRNIILILVGVKNWFFFFSLSTQLKEAASRNSKAKIFNFIFTITVYFLYLDKIKIAI